MVLDRVHKNIWRFVLLYVFIVLLATGCSLEDVFSEPLYEGTEMLTPPVSGTEEPVVGDSNPIGVATVNAAALTPTPTLFPTAEGNEVITLWLPPQLDPSDGSEAGRILQLRLTRFAAQNPGVDVEVRIKSVSGTGGMVESLSTAKTAAPQALPSLVVMPRYELEVAALKGLLIPYDGLSQVIDDGDWYPYARQMAQVQDQTFGLPFAGDALLVVYRPSQIELLPDDWASMLTLGTPISFPAAEDNALVTLALYQSAGGEIEDALQRPMLQPEVLVDVLYLYEDGIEQGAFLDQVSRFRTDHQAWQAYREESAHILVTWSSLYLKELPADSIAVPLPSWGAARYTLATGWAVGLSDPSAARRELSVALAEYLVDSEFMSEWTAAAGYLPPKPSALVDWTNRSLEIQLNQVSASAELYPDNIMMKKVGPVLNRAVLSVMDDSKNPLTAAQSAAEELKAPEIQ